MEIAQALAASFTTFALIAHWSRLSGRTLWSILGAGLLLAFASELMNMIGALLIAVLITSASIALSKEKSRLERTITWGLLLAIGFLFTRHLTQGFQPWEITPIVSFSIDTPVLGFVLLAYLSWPKLKPRHRPRSTALIGLGVLIVGFGITWLTGALPFDARLPPAWLAFALVNLVAVVIPEELLFRGLIQNQVQNRFKNDWLAISIAAAVFGLVHTGSGWLWAVHAGIAGFFYGWIYRSSGRFEWAILAHWVVNLTHFFLFRYPS